MTVYLAGFARTQAAAQRLEAGSDARRRPADARTAAADPAARSVVNSRHDENGVMVASAPTAAPGQPATSTPAATTLAAPTVAAASAPSGVSMSATTSAGTSSAATTSSPATTATATVATTAASAVTTTAVSQTSAPSAVAVAPAPAVPVPTTTPAAPVAAPAAPAAPAVDSAKSAGWKDGTYSGWGTSRHGDIEATVVIENGKITGAIISRCLTRYSCSWVAHLQAQVVTRQSPEVDNVSGATQSANAFYYAVVDALSKAK